MVQSHEQRAGREKMFGNPDRGAGPGKIAAWIFDLIELAGEPFAWLGIRRRFRPGRRFDGGVDLVELVLHDAWLCLVLELLEALRTDASGIV